MQEYSIMIPGDAVPQGRPRVVRIGGRTIAYDPPKSKAYKEKEWLRKNGILSLPEALRLLEGDKNE